MLAQDEKMTTLIATDGSSIYHGNLLAGRQQDLFILLGQRPTSADTVLQATVLDAACTTPAAGRPSWRTRWASCGSTSGELLQHLLG